MRLLAALLALLWAMPLAAQLDLPTEAEPTASPTPVQTIAATQDAGDDRRIAERIDGIFAELPAFAAVEVEDSLKIFLGQIAKDNSPIEPKHVGSTENNTEGSKCRGPGAHLEDAEQHQELADEAAGARQANRDHGKDQKHSRINRHAMHQAAIGLDETRMHAIVNHADA